MIAEGTILPLCRAELGRVLHRAGPLTLGLPRCPAGVTLTLTLTLSAGLNPPEPVGVYDRRNRRSPSLPARKGGWGRTVS